MNRYALRFAATFAGLISVTLFVGCMTGITPDTTIPDALAALAQAAGQDTTLNQLTIGDVVQAFEQYASQVSAGTTAGTAPTPLTQDQQTQLEDLQGQLDRGEITPNEFAQQVHDLIGDVAPGMAFAGMGMMGGPFREGPGMRLAAQLQLTEEQQQQAQDIFTRLHTDIETLRQNAQDAIKALLTTDQLATLDELMSQRRPLPGGPGGRMGPGMMAGEPGRGMGPGGERMGGQMGPPPASPDEAGAGLGPLARFADELQLTDDQKAAIEQIHTDLQAAVEARHQQARDEFRAILTADQLTLLDQLESQQPQ